MSAGGTLEGLAAERSDERSMSAESDRVSRDAIRLKEGIATCKTYILRGLGHTQHQRI
jgi:hypothetical protein